ncbi:MAG: PaaI family thioesterase [Melioribacteraceae bacterium]|nr:MAG: PaaI family thioesterase [Melioribacteraceae bacterium]
MNKLAFQDFYPDDVAHCYGCGKLNDRGHQIKTYWDGEETVTRFTPKDYHTAIPGFVYGGLIASLIDCHGTGSAAAAMYKHENREMDTDPPLRFVTAQLNVTYLKPTPLGPELILKGKIREVKGKKVIVDVELFADEQLCAKGEVIAVKIPEILLQK